MSLKAFFRNERNRKYAAIILIILVVGILLAAIPTVNIKAEDTLDTCKRSSTANMSTEEEKLLALLERASDISDVTVCITTDEEDGKIQGAAVVCRGGNDPQIKIKIISLISALYDIPSNKVYVLGSK